MLNYGLLIRFWLPYAVAALLGLIYAASWVFANVDDANVFQTLVNVVANPEVANINRAQLGELDNPTAVGLSLTSSPGDYLSFFRNVLLLDFDYLKQGWLQMLRWTLVVLAAPLNLIVLLFFVQILAGMVRGIAGVALPFLRP